MTIFCDWHVFQTWKANITVVVSWEALEKSLRDLILNQAAIEADESQYGKKYIVEGPFTSLSGDIMQIVTVWVILKDENIPRFITAYPGGLR